MYSIREETQSALVSSVDGDGNPDDHVKKHWKPAKFQSYETMGLTKTKLNVNTRPCGFRATGKMRTIKSTCLIARMKRHNMLKNMNPKLAICITMYNENENELKTTMTGILQNYNAMYSDPDIKLR
jgi:hypothetical protein